MPALFYRIDYFEVSLETKCHTCSYTFVEFPDIDNYIYSCPKCSQLYKIKVEVKPISKIEAIKKTITRDYTPNPPFDSEE